MPSTVYHSAHSPPQPPQPSRPRLRRWIAVVAGGLTAFGVLGAIGGYYVPGLLDRLGAQVTGRVPLEVDLVGDRTVSPNYVFGAGVAPSDVPVNLLHDQRLPEFQRWARDHGGVIADEQVIRFVVRGRDEKVLHLDDVRVRIVERSEPRPGWVNVWSGCGAQVEPRLLQVDADGNERPQWIVNDEPVDRPAFTVTSTEQETIDIMVTSRAAEIRWVVEFSYTSAEKDGVLVVDDGGKPFVLTTVTHAQAYESATNEQPLRRAPERDATGPQPERPPC